MTRILALLDDSPSAFAVFRTATRLAAVMDAVVDAVHVRSSGLEGSPARPGAVPPAGDEPAGDALVGADRRVLVGDPVPVLQGELAGDDVIAGVIAARSTRAKPVGHVALALVATSPVPLVVLPPGHRGLIATQPELLVPLDGVAATTAAVSPVVGALVGAGAHLRVVHFFDSGALPPFVDTVEDVEVLAEEFRRRHLPEHAERCDLRVGDPAHHIIELARDHPVDAIVVAWHQDLTPGRAEVIRRLLGESPVPLIMVPIPTADEPNRR